MSAFVIINEWEYLDEGGSEVVDSRYFTSEDSAHRALSLIAESPEMELRFNETSISKAVGDEYEEYYIQELTLGD